MAKNLDLDVDSPDKVARILRAAAQEYSESASELEASWQDPGVGKPWDAIGEILESAADKIDQKLKKMKW